MKILLTNDDGWDAHGLQTLRSVCEPWCEVWTVAPLHAMSGISHQMTFERPLTLTETAERAFALDGTPADCVRIATTQLGVDFDWVLSGINNGGNLGADIYVSGTVAATREATLRGVRSIALSQHRRKFNAEFDWTMTAWMAHEILERYLHQPETVAIRTAINVNFPDRYHSEDASQSNKSSDRTTFMDSLSIVECELNQHPMSAEYVIDEQGRFLYAGKYNDRLRADNCDVAVCFNGGIAISVMRF